MASGQPITVMGAGIFGLSIAWEIMRRGAKVRVLEPVGIGAGSSGGLVGAMQPHVPEDWNPKKAFQLNSLLMAEGWWRKVEAASNQRSGYGKIGRLQPVADAEALALAETRAENANRLWRGQAEWRVMRTSGSEWSPITPTGWIIRDTLSARINPKLALASLAGALKTSINITDEQPDTGIVIWATGVAGLQEMAAGGGVKGQAMLLRHEARDLPQIFADGLHVVPHADGTVAIGSTSENEWENPTSTDAQLEALYDKAIALCPGLSKSMILKRWAGVRPRATSRAPLLGAWPGRPGHFIANGGFKIGFGIAPKVAEVMADLVLDGQDTIPEGFKPV